MPLYAPPGGVKRYAVIGIPHAADFNFPHENSVVFLRRALTSGSHKNATRYSGFTLAHLNHLLAKSPIDQGLHGFSVAGGVVSREDTAPGKMCILNFAVHGEAIVHNVWTHVSEGAMLGFIVKQVDLPKSAEYGIHYDGTKSAVDVSGKKFQVLPWCSLMSVEPSKDELMYTDEAGEVCDGTFLPFGKTLKVLEPEDGEGIDTAATDICINNGYVRVDLDIFSDAEVQPDRFEEVFFQRFPKPTK